MRSAASTLIKGMICAVCFIAATVLILHFTEIRTDLRWTAGNSGKNIISVAGDGSGNTKIVIGEKNIEIKQSDIESVADRLAELLK